MQPHDSTVDTNDLQPFRLTPQSSQQYSTSDTAGHLFQTAVLLLGDEQAAALVVEQAVGEAAIDPCVDFEASANELTNQTVIASLTRIRAGGSTLDAPSTTQDSITATCIESDDLSASGISTVQLQEMVAGSGRVKLRQWLEQLSPLLRVVFVVRAIVGRGNEQTASILFKGGATGWTADQVSLNYRQALCSLATSLVNFTNPHAQLLS